MSWARLPSWLWPTAEILNFGQSYPNGDPDQMRAFGDQWSGLADRLEGWIDAIKYAVQRVGSHLVGDGQAAFHQQSDYMISDGQTNLESTVASMRQVQGMTYNAATSIDYTQQQQDFFCAMAAYQVIQLAQTLAGSAAIPGVYAAFRQLVQLASRDCAEVVARDAAADAIAAMLAEQAPKVFEEIGANLTREAARDLGEKAAQTLGRDGLSTIGRDTAGELGAGAARDVGENTLGQGARAAGRDVTADVLGQGGRAAARDVAVDVLERGGSAAGRDVTAEALAQAGGAAGRHALTDLASDGARDLVGQQLGDAAARDGAGLITKVGGDVAAKSAEKLLLKPLAEDAAKTAGEQEAKKEAEGFSLKALAKKAALEGAKQAGQGAALDLGIQADQIARGQRSGFDAEQFMSTSLSWGGGVILGHPAGEVVGEKLAERGFVTRFVAGVGTAAALNVPGMALGDTVGRAMFQAGEAGLGVLDPTGNHHADWSHVTFGLNPQQFLAIGGMHGVGMFTHDLAVRRGIVAGDFGQVDEMFGNLAIRSVPTDGTGPDNAFRQDYQRRLGAAYFDAQAKAKSGNPIPLKAFQQLREELDTRQGVTSDRRTGALSNPSAGPANRTVGANERTGATNGRAPHGATATTDRTGGPTRGAMAGPRGADASGGPVVIHRAESAVSHSDSALTAGSGVVRAQASDGASAGTSVHSDAVVSQSEPAIAASSGEVRPSEPNVPRSEPSAAPDVVVPQSEPMIVTSSSDIRVVVQNGLGTDAAVPQPEMASVAVGEGLRGEIQHGAGPVASSIADAASAVSRPDTSVPQSAAANIAGFEAVHTEARGGVGPGAAMIPDTAVPQHNSSVAVGGNGGSEGAPERWSAGAVPPDLWVPPTAGDAARPPLEASEPVAGPIGVDGAGRPAGGAGPAGPSEPGEHSGDPTSAPADAAGLPYRDHGTGEAGAPGADSPAAVGSHGVVASGDHVDAEGGIAAIGRESAGYGDLHEAVVDARAQADQRWIGALADAGVDVAAADPAAVAALRDAAANDHAFVGRNGQLDRGPRDAARREFADAARAVGIDVNATDPARLRALRDTAVRDRETQERLDHLNRAAEAVGDEADPALLTYTRAVVAHHDASVRFDETTAELPEHAAWLLRSPANRFGALDTLTRLLSGGNGIELTDAQRAELHDAVIGYQLTGIESAMARAEIDAAHAEGDGSASNAAPALPGRLRRGSSGTLPSPAHGAEDLPAGENVEPSPAAARPSAEHLASMDGSVPQPATAEQGEHRAEPAVSAESESGAGNILRRPDENARPAVAAQHSTGKRWDSERGVPDRNGRRSASPVPEDGSRIAGRRRWGVPWRRGPRESVLPEVSGRIEPRRVELPGPNRDSVAGVVTDISPHSRLTSGGDDVPSLVLSSVEARGPDHIDLGLTGSVDISQALVGENRSGMVRIESNGHTVDATVLYRDFDSGVAQATVIYDRPHSDHPEFLNVRRMIDAALRDRFPGRRIDMFEVHTRHGGDEVFERVLEPGSASDSQAWKSELGVPDGAGRRGADPLLDDGSHPPGHAHARDGMHESASHTSDPVVHGRRSVPEPGQSPADEECCAVSALGGLVEQLGPESGVWLPEQPIGPSGMSGNELMARAGGKLVDFDSHEAIKADLLSREDENAIAVVVDMYRDPDDNDRISLAANGIGGHAYLMSRRGDSVWVRDIWSGEEFEFTDPSQLPWDVSTSAIVFDGGRPDRTLDEATREEWLRQAQAKLDDPNRVGIGAKRAQKSPGGQEPPDGSDPAAGSSDGGAEQHMFVDHLMPVVLKFLAEHVTEHAADPQAPHGPAEPGYVPGLIEAIGLREALGNHPDPRRALRELAEEVRVQGELAGAQGGELFSPSEKRASVGSPPASATPRVRSPQDAREELLRGLGLRQEDLAGADRGNILEQLQVRNILRAAAIEALADHALRADAAATPEEGARLGALRDDWARRLGADPADFATPTGAARRLDDLRARAIQRANDIADLVAFDNAMRDPAQQGHEIVVELGRERVRLRVETDDAGGWRVVDEVPREAVPAEHADDAAGAGRRSWLRRLWRRVFAPPIRPHTGAPSGSGSALPSPPHGEPHPDVASGGAGMEHGMSIFDHLSAVNDFVTKLSIGLTADVITIVTNRERIGNFFRNRHRDSELPPARLSDGTVYEPEISEADPKLRAQLVLPDEQRDHLNRRTEPLDSDPPVSAQRPSLAEPSHPANGEQHTPSTDDRAVLRDWLRESDALQTRRREVADAIVQLARDHGLDLPDLTHESVQRAVDHLEYQIVRRTAVIDGWAEASEAYRNEDEHIRFNRYLSIDDNEPTQRFQLDGARAAGHEIFEILLRWQSLPNKTAPLPPVWHDLFDSDGNLSESVLPTLFETALRREQIVHQRDSWEQMLPEDPSRDPERMAEARIEMSARTGEGIWALEELRSLAREFESVDDKFRAVSETLVHLAGEEWLAHDPNATQLEHNVWRVGGQPDRLVVLDSALEHDEILARTLAKYPSLAVAVNRGDLVPDYRVGWVEPDGSVRIGQLGAPQVRHLDGIVDGRRARVTLIREGNGAWHPVLEHPIDPAPAAGAPNHPAAHNASAGAPRPRAEVEQDLHALGQRLGLEKPGDLLRGGLELVEAEQLHNGVRAVQIEALVDYACSATEIEEFRGLGQAHGDLASRLGVAARDLTPEGIADALSDPRLGKSARRRIAKELANFAGEVRSADPAAVDGARDRLARRLGCEPEDFFPKKRDENLKYVSDQTSLSPKRLSKAIRRAVRLEGDGPDAASALTEYARTLMTLDESAKAWAGDTGADPRVVGSGISTPSDTAYADLYSIVRKMVGTDEATPEQIAERLVDPSLARQRRRVLVEALVDCVREVGPDHSGEIASARDRLARQLEPFLRLGLWQEDLYGERYDDDFHRHRDATGITDAKYLTKKLHRAARHSPDHALAEPVADFVRAVLNAEPFARRPEAAPVAGGEMRVHDDTSPAHLRDVIGNLADFADRMGGTVHTADENGVHRDWARIIGLDPASEELEKLPEFVQHYRELNNPKSERYRNLENMYEKHAEAYEKRGKNWQKQFQDRRRKMRVAKQAEIQRRIKNYVRVFDAYRDLVIEKHERLSPKELARVHSELRGEVRQRAAHLARAATLLDEHRASVAVHRQDGLAAAAEAVRDAVQARGVAEQRLRAAIDRVAEVEQDAADRGDPAASGKPRFDTVIDRRQLPLVLGRLRGHVMPEDTPQQRDAAQERRDAYDELERAAGDYHDAVEAVVQAEKHHGDLAVRDAILSADAHPLAGEPRVGIIEGPPRRVLVVVRGESGTPGEALEHAVDLDPAIDAIAGPNRENIVVLRVLTDGNGLTTVHREDPPEPPDGSAAAPPPNTSGSGGGQSGPAPREDDAEAAGPMRSAAADPDTSGPSGGGSDPASGEDDAEAAGPMPSATADLDPSGSGGDGSGPVSGEPAPEATWPEPSAGSAADVSGSGGGGRSDPASEEPDSEAAHPTPSAPPPPAPAGGSSGSSGSTPSHQGSSPTGWTTVGAARPHRPTTFAAEIADVVTQISDQVAVRDRALADARESARSLEVEHWDTLDADQLKVQIQAAQVALEDHIQELWARGATGGRLYSFFDEVEEAERKLVAAGQHVKTGTRRLSDFHVAADAVATLRGEAARLLARDVIASEQATPVPGEKFVAFLPGRPTRLLVVSNSPEPDWLIGRDIRNAQAKNGVTIFFRQTRVDEAGQGTVIDLRPPEAGEPMPQGARAPEQPRGEVESLRRQIQELTTLARRAGADPAGAVLDCQRARGMLQELRDRLESELAQRKALLAEAEAARAEAAGAVGAHVSELAAVAEEAHLQAQGEVTRLENELAQVDEQGRELADLHAGIDQRLEDAGADRGSLLSSFGERPRPRSVRVTGDGTAGHTGPHAHARPDGTNPRTTQSDSGRGRPSGMDPSVAQPDSGTGRRSASGAAHPHGDGTRTNAPVAAHNSGSMVHPAEGSVAGASRGGQCGVLALRELLRMFGRISGIRMPSRLVGLGGMSEGEIEACAGGKFRPFGAHGDIAAELLGTPEQQARGVKNGAAALVVDLWTTGDEVDLSDSRELDPRDEHGVGGHAFLMVNEGNRIVVRDLFTGEEFTDLSRLPGGVWIKAILFDRNGHPLEPIDDRERDEKAHDAIHQLGDAKRVGIGRPRESPGEGERARDEENAAAGGGHGGGQPPTVHHDPPPPETLEPAYPSVRRAGAENVASYLFGLELDENLAAPAVYRSVDGPGEDGAVTEIPRNLSSSAPEDSYRIEDQRLMAVHDYVIGIGVRSRDTYATSSEGRPVVIDNPGAFPRRGASGLAHPTIYSDFVMLQLDKPLPADLLAKVRAIDLPTLRSRMLQSRLGRDEIDAMFDRLHEIREHGRITGKAWHGAIDSPDTLARSRLSQYIPPHRRAAFRVWDVPTDDRRPDVTGGGAADPGGTAPHAVPSAPADEPYQFSGKGIRYKAQKGESDPYVISDGDEQGRLTGKVLVRQMQQSLRDSVGAAAKALMPEFGIRDINHLAGKKLEPAIAAQEAAIDQSSLSDAEKQEKISRLYDLRGIAEHYHNIGPNMVDTSRQIGDIPGFAYANDPAVHPNAVVMLPLDTVWEGGGSFDVPLFVPARAGEPPIFKAIENKGLGSPLGTAGTPTGRAQQGAPEYYARTLEIEKNLARVLTETPETMRARGIDPDSPAARKLLQARDELLGAFHDGTLVFQYELARTDINGSTTITKFVLERDGTPVSIQAIGGIIRGRTATTRVIT